MHILALNPYHTGSHAAFLEGWVAHSRHSFEVMTLPGHHWKWRMRHAAATFAQQWHTAPQAEAEASKEVSGKVSGVEAGASATRVPGAISGAGPGIKTIPGAGVVWCTSMLDLAAFYGLSGFRGPAVIYFHENQLTYPTRKDDPRDHHFAVTHLTSALAAIQHGGEVWWNSAYHRDSFLTAARKLLQKMPGRELDHVPNLIEGASKVLSPGVVDSGGGVPGMVPGALIPGAGGDTGSEVPRPLLGSTKNGDPLHILWVARWEHDKDPDGFFAALKKLKKRGVAFRLSVIGESFEQMPECFAVAKKRFADEIVRWGYQATRAEYDAALHEADVVVSTARHEFFGLAMVEAASAGCFPVLPKRLAYPEVFGDRPEFYYDGTPEGLATRLMELAREHAEQPLGKTLGGVSGAEAVQRYRWKLAAGRLDEAMDGVGG